MHAVMLTQWNSIHLAKSFANPGPAVRCQRGSLHRQTLKKRSVRHEPGHPHSHHIAASLRPERGHFQTAKERTTQARISPKTTPFRTTPTWKNRLESRKPLLRVTPLRPERANSVKPPKPLRQEFGRFCDEKKAVTCNHKGHRHQRQQRYLKTTGKSTRWRWARVLECPDGKAQAIIARSLAQKLSLAHIIFLAFIYGPLVMPSLL